jgi:hypothetical protein
MLTNTIGTCSNCGGRVCIPQVWYGTTPPTACCDTCGAVPAESHGPVIPMKKPKAKTVLLQEMFTQAAKFFEIPAMEFRSAH